MALYNEWQRSKLEPAQNSNYSKRSFSDNRSPFKWEVRLMSWGTNVKYEPTSEEYLEKHLRFRTTDEYEERKKLQKTRTTSQEVKFNPKKPMDDLTRRFLYTGIRSREAQYNEIYDKYMKGKEWLNWSTKGKASTTELKSKAGRVNTEGRFQKSYDIIRDTKPDSHEIFRTDWSEDEWKSCVGAAPAGKKRN